MFVISGRESFTGKAWVPETTEDSTHKFDYIWNLNFRMEKIR